MSTTVETAESPLIGHEFRYSKDRFRIIESARDTEDGSSRADYFAAPRAKVPEHVHRDQEESFEVVSGTLRIRVGGRELTLGPGQSAVGPPDVPHTWWNPSDNEEAHFLVGLRPGIEVETMLETLLGLARDGKTVKGLPRNPLQLAVLIRDMGSWAYPPWVPKPARRVLYAPVKALAFVGEMLGYRASYPEYSSPGQRVSSR